jgi:hypothetical protein
MKLVSFKGLDNGQEITKAQPAYSRLKSEHGVISYAEPLVNGFGTTVLTHASKR